MANDNVSTHAIGAGVTVKLLPGGQWKVEAFGPNGSMRQKLGPIETSDLKKMLPGLLDRALASSPCNCMQCLRMRVLRADVDEGTLRLAAFNQTGCDTTGGRA